MKLAAFLTFIPIFQYRIWGGEKLKTKLNKNYDENNIGESWEISGVQGFVSKLMVPVDGCENLQQLIEKHPEEILGKRVYEKYGTQFPLLIKFIDSKEPLSVQVHPDDEFAQRQHHSLGKTEMWYILEADENAEIISGFSRKIDLEQYRHALKTNEIDDAIKKWKVKKGDTIFLPAGRVHAIGAGILLTEIQQSSDITYRIYDYNRIDKDGNTRELHNDMAEKVINFDDTENPIIPQKSSSETVENLVTCKYFTTNLLSVTGSITRDYRAIDSFVILIAVEGNVKLTAANAEIELSLGQTVMIPAAFIGHMKISQNTHSRLLEVYCE